MENGWERLLVNAESRSNSRPGRSEGMGAGAFVPRVMPVKRNCGSVEKSKCGWSVWWLLECGDSLVWPCTAEAIEE